MNNYNLFNTLNSIYRKKTDWAGGCAERLSCHSVFISYTAEDSLHNIQIAGWEINQDLNKF